MKKFEGLYLFLDFSDLSYLSVRIILQKEIKHLLWTRHMYSNVLFLAKNLRYGLHLQEASKQLGKAKLSHLKW